MVIVETSVFTRRVMELLPDDEYRELQAILLGNCTRTHLDAIHLR